MAGLPRTPAVDVYRIERRPDGTLACWALRGARKRRLAHVAVHSPTGFECGYSGSGPADLALSILADLFGTPRAARAYRAPRGRTAQVWCLHQLAKARWIAPLQVAPGALVDLDAREIYAWALEQRDRLAEAGRGPQEVGAA